MNPVRPSLTTPLVVAAVAAAVVAIGSSALVYNAMMAGTNSYLRMLLAPQLITWPLRGSGTAMASISFLIGLLLFILAVVVGSWLGGRAARATGGSWAVALSAWLGAVIGAMLAGAADGLFRLSANFSSLENMAFGLTQGPYAGVFYGWIIALAVGLAFRAANRGAAGTGSGGTDTTSGVSPFGSPENR